MRGPFSTPITPLPGSLFYADPQRLGWQQAYVSRYETGERQLSVDEYVAVALAIGIDPVGLLGEILSQNCP